MHTEETEKSGGRGALEEAPLHRAPSMLWFVIPMGLLVLYALLTR
jgi:hypothetical protein